ncbi:MAG TPA: hypothetical protein VGG10_08350 [Rhizomicrobium sp.]|jgi:hypothetical protein
MPKRRKRGDQHRTAKVLRKARTTPSVSGKLPKKPSGQSAKDAKLQFALRVLSAENNFGKAANAAHLSEKQLRAYAVKKGIAEKRGRRLVIKKNLTRKLLVFSDGREHKIVTDKSRTSSLVGRYMAAVRWFVQTNNINLLKPFAGKAVRDSAGKSYPLETRPNVLHRLASSGGSSFEQVYRIVV